ncbi:helix-turn-helix transcriptional regulator [Natronosalvus amylolyticus]|uniref:helix-turn-helix transcriptional regulator n=1 Tax=Natronosalvus amylolyticus TaxID=2961994 RepID=UPI0020C97485|nr:hypothetical protein [Natronosalvus amylolyticus]
MATDTMIQESRSSSYEEILNVLREADGDTLTTPEIEQALPIGIRATQKKVRELEEMGRLVLDREGNTNRWRLADTEPQKPVYHPAIADAKRKRAKAYELGDKAFIIGIGLGSAAGIVMAYHVFFLQIGADVPILSQPTLPFTASVFGLLASLFFVATFVAKTFGYVILRWQHRQINEDSLSR